MTKTDMEKHFGLVRVNGTPKPSFNALKNLLHLLSDPGPAVQTRSLSFQLSGATTNLQYTLLQKRDGTFWLALFQEAVSYDPNAHRDLKVPPQAVALKLPWRASEVRVYRPNSSVEPTGKWEKVDELNVDAPDEVLLVEIKPPRVPHP